MRLLALDTAGDGCSVGVFDDGAALAFRWCDDRQGHAETLPPMLEAVLAESGCALEHLEALAVTVGPGSFTGIRTGLALARGLALVTGLEGFAVTTLAALAAPLAGPLAMAEGQAAPIAALLDARRGQVYLQRFSGSAQALDRPQVLTPEAAAAKLGGGEPVRLVGSGAPLVQAHLAEGAASRVEMRLDARGVAAAAFAMAKSGKSPVAGFELGPLYLRPADARPDAGRSLLRAMPAVARG